MSLPSQQVELVLGLRTARLVMRTLALKSLSATGEDKRQLERLAVELQEKIRKADVRYVRVEVVSCQPTEGNSSSSPASSNGSTSTSTSDE